MHSSWETWFAWVSFRKQLVKTPSLKQKANFIQKNIFFCKKKPTHLQHTDKTSALVVRKSEQSTWLHHGQRKPRCKPQPAAELPFATAKHISSLQEELTGEEWQKLEDTQHERAPRLVAGRPAGSMLDKGQHTPWCSVLASALSRICLN